MPEGTPTEEVIRMRQQGMNNNQIMSTLQRSGYDSSQILDAMNQANIKAQLSPTTLKKGDMMPEQPMQYQERMPADMPPMEAASMGPDDMAYAGSDRERIEELAETIIDEKWADLVDNINRIIEWKEKTEARISEIETKFNGLKDNFDKLHGAILERVGQYDRNILEVGTEIKALEKVFQKVLPGFMENVAELSRITDKMRK